MNKHARSALLRGLLLLILLYFFPAPTIFYLLCGLYDVSRNRNLNPSVLQGYFLGNGMLTWLLSPFNIVMDLLTLPYFNKGIYRLEDLPKPYQDEVRRLMDDAHHADLVGQLHERTKDLPRTMIFFKWYGSNLDSVVNLPVFHQDYRYIQTIGVSVFNRRQSTSRHFGPLRATLRILYNLNVMEDRSAYIEVGDVKNYWRDTQLFIFDDTLQHQSFNESDQARYCLFVDILRPTLFPAVLRGAVVGIRFFLKGGNSIFYKNWKFLTNGS